MVGSSLISVSSSTYPTLLPLNFASTVYNPNHNSCIKPCLYSNPRKKSVIVRATSGNQEQNSEWKNPLAVVMDIPRTLWKQILRPLSDFGFGRGSIWEGGVGLFVVSGTVLLALSLVWLKGFQLRSRYKKYVAVLEFTQAAGICTGTSVRIRGVTVGNVIRVNPSLKNIEAVVEIDDEKTIIPKNSLIEVNQSGLLMETMIDITPQDPIPYPSLSPLNADCGKEGLIVCDREKIKGYQGISLDALVGIFTRFGCDVEEIGISNAYLLAEQVSSVIQEAKPLLTKMEAMAEDVQPLLTELRHGNLLYEVESLTKSLTQTSEDLRRVHSTIMTPENTQLIQKSISTLIYTLKNIENISSDIKGFTGDEATRLNLKLLIKSLSRLL